MIWIAMIIIGLVMLVVIDFVAHIKRLTFLRDPSSGSILGVRITRRWRRKFDPHTDISIVDRRTGVELDVSIFPVGTKRDDIEASSDSLQRKMDRLENATEHPLVRDTLAGRYGVAEYFWGTNRNLEVGTFRYYAFGDLHLPQKTILRFVIRSHRTPPEGFRAAFDVLLSIDLLQSPSRSRNGARPAG